MDKNSEKKSENSSSEKLKEIKYKIERFFGKNIIFFGLVLVFILFKLNSTINNLEQTQDNLSNELSKIQMSYVSITDSGILNNLPRTFINPAEKENEVAEILKVLLVDRATISKGFTVSEFEKPSDMLDNSYDLQSFLYNYILIQRGLSDDLKNAQKDGYGHFNAYLSSVNDLFRGISENGQKVELPHYLKVVDKKINKYEFKDNSFSIDVSYTTTINTYGGLDPVTKKPIWKQRNGTSRIIAKGFFDIQTQNIGINYEEKLANTKIRGINYSGLHFSYFKVYYGV